MSTTQRDLIDLIDEVAESFSDPRRIWGEILREGYNRLVRVARREVRRLAASGLVDEVEVVHETIVTLGPRFLERGAIGGFDRAKGRLGPYLAVSLRKELRRTALRMIAKGRRPAGRAGTDLVGSVAQDDRWSPADLVLLVEAINTLPDAERAVAALVYLEGAGLAEVMDRLVIGRSTYYLRLARAKEFLEARLLNGT